MRRSERGAKFFLPCGPGTFQGVLNAANDRFPNRGRITKPHFALCRVNIHIDNRWIELKKQERNRILSFHKSSMVALTDSGSDEVAVNGAAVYKDELLRSGLATHACLPDKTADSNLRRSRAVHGHQALQQGDTIQIAGPITERGSSGQLKQNAVVS